MPDSSTDAAYDAMELQILDNTAEKYADARSGRLQGSINSPESALLEKECLAEQ